MRVQTRIQIILTALVLVPMTAVQSQDTLETTQADTVAPAIVRVEAINVCMGMAVSKLYDREMLPVVVDGKTYYGCCTTCIETLSNDPESRQAVDPLSGEVVDKATAVLGALPDGVVHYFESEETMALFAQQLREKKE